MKKYSSFLTLTLGIWIGVSAQEIEWQTYFGELRGYKLNYPIRWIPELERGQSAGQRINILDPETPGNAIQIVITTDATIKSVYNTHKKEIIQEAKNLSDDFFKILNEGKEKISSGQISLWIEYNKTAQLDSEGKTQIRNRDYIIRHKFAGAPFVDIFLIGFSSPEKQWQHMKNIFEKSFNSLEFINK